jgi:hypothetical protein
MDGVDQRARCLLPLDADGLMPEYAFYEYIYDYPELAVALNELESRLRLRDRPDAADILVKAWADFQRELRQFAKDMAVFAPAELVDRERTTRVRPDPHGGGGPRLEDSLVAEPVLTGLVPGSIGVANEDLLDANVPWWLTNEIGSSGRVGSVLYGLFYGSGNAEAPGASSFRVHPLFAPGKAPGYGSGMIENPIPAREFIAGTRASTRSRRR